MSRIIESGADEGRLLNTSGEFLFAVSYDYQVHQAPSGMKSIEGAIEVKPLSSVMNHDYLVLELADEREITIIVGSYNAATGYGSFKGTGPIRSKE